MRRLGPLAFLLGLLGSASARAEPTIWQRAADPTAAARARARLHAERLLDEARQAREDPGTYHDLSLGSAALLELSGAKRDPWQSVLLGRLLLEVKPGREREAMQLIESGLLGLPDSDFKLESWFDLGIGALQIGDLARAERAFTASLALAWDPDDRARSCRNRGRARMLAGRVSAAVTDYRAAVRLARDTEGSALSHFGLGVALERSGDYPQAMQEIARGVAIRLPTPPYPSPSVLDIPGLIWVPEYEVHYFQALAAMSEAESADSAELREASYESALVSWEQYLPAAQAQNDRFAPNAVRHQKRCEDALQRLRRQPASRGVR